MCAYATVCVLILLYMCPHSATHVSSCYSMCPHTAIYVSSVAANMPGHIYSSMRTHSAIFVSSYYSYYYRSYIYSSMRTHSAVYVSSYYSYYYRSSVFSSSTLSTATKWRRLHPRTTPKTTRLKVRSSPTIYVFSYCYMCVLILLYNYICVLLIRRRLLAWRYGVALPDMCPHPTMCPRTRIYESSY